MTTEADVAAAVDGDEIVDVLREWVAIPSVDGTPAEAEAQRWGAERLRSMGFVVDQWETSIDELRADEAYPGMEVARDHVVGCVGVLGPEGVGPALALGGHTDVVPPGDHQAWTGGDPFALRSDGVTVRARGACDMKGGLAAVLGAVAAVQRLGTTLTRPLAVHLVSAEEDGGVGTFSLLRRRHRADACVIAEPTSGTVVPANAGALTFRLEVPGLATHGSTRAEGVSAVEKFEWVHGVLRAFEADRNRDLPPLFAHLDPAWPLSVGTVAAGDWASTVPDRLVAAGRFGTRPGEPVADAKAAFEAAVAAACAEDPWLAEHPATVTWPGGLFAAGALPDGHPFLDEVCTAVADAGSPAPPVKGAPYGSDLRHYAAAGVPTVQYGPGDVRHAHAVDEQVEVADLVACARAYALLILRRCATG